VLGPRWGVVASGSGSSVKAVSARTRRGARDEKAGGDSRAEESVAVVSAAVTMVKRKSLAVDVSVCGKEIK